MSSGNGGSTGRLNDLRWQRLQPGRRGPAVNDIPAVESGGVFPDFAASCSNVEPSPRGRLICTQQPLEDATMDGLIYLVGLVVIVMAILSFFGLR